MVRSNGKSGEIFSQESCVSICDAPNDVLFSRLALQPLTEPLLTLFDDAEDTGLHYISHQDPLAKIP